MISDGHAAPGPTDPASAGSRIVARCLALGFALAGIAPAHSPIRRAEFEAWLAAGMHGEMGYLAEHAAVRADIQRFLPGARSVVMVADQYSDRNARPSAAPPGSAAGRVARYAHGRDYHDVMKRRLHTLCDELRADYPDHQFRAFVDTAPVPERDFAAAAGLGWIGKHTLLISPRLGSWLLLGGIATTLHASDTHQPFADACGTCTRCIDACPTGAISPYRVDATRCISYLTIEHRSLVDPRLGERSDNWIFGCDVCQDVCPHNSPRPPGVDVGSALPEYAGANHFFPLDELLGWTADARRGRLSGSAMKRASLVMLKRNAVIAIANAARAAPVPVRATVLERLERLVNDADEDPLVRDQARLCVEQLRGGQA
ncbi:MAG: tRNA epoxyqueuosine(34) reductase QueG [Phycisphaerae bacterium]